MNEAQIRAHERGRLSALLQDNAETIASFAKDGEAAVRVVALMLDLAPSEHKPDEWTVPPSDAPQGDGSRTLADYFNGWPLDPGTNVVLLPVRWQGSESWGLHRFIIEPPPF